MHIIGGILLLVLVFGGGFFVYTSGVLQPLFGPLGSSLGFQNSTSTVQGNSSEYYKEVAIEFVSLGGGLNQPMVLSLEGKNSSAHEGIVLTGWTLVTSEGKYSIPKVANLYSPSVPGVAPEDIYLRAGGKVNFYSGKNAQGNQQAIRSALGEWQIWLNQDFLASPHGSVVLKDSKGKTVSEYKY
jgi:hypothetical protein